ncbi:ABC transporter ATP-binding protein [Virgisporangium aurantiacum]|uniref:Macrolide ABC transporter ATP-binding protein n=1 Tax=Virgisporangium aurantiacum TaxID=175570 RepID=A0A8J3YYQ5_9ACTN|nr:ABC transporter ATP-binding protein [Virgisporangium aurantiacum]GIJ54134.1 macrolide ABC transporter ATP-binding protein [Virgisporangium aurantiacum]
MSAEAALQAIELTRRYRRVAALSGVSIAVARGEVVAVTGPSGSGKSTLLHLLGGLDRPDAGRVLIGGVDWRTLGGAARSRLRLRSCGFLPQGMSLLPQATAAENVEVPLLLGGAPRAERYDRTLRALDRVGLAEHTDKLPDQLSGGQQQRVAIARALIAEPVVVLADEPTGSLDSANAQAVTRLLIAAATERRAAVVLVTHDPAVARHADRIVTLHSGQLNGEPS